MKIVVCVKRVPDTASKLKVAGDGKGVDTSDLEYVVSPYDEIAMEQAVQIKEKNSDVEVVVMSMGSEDAEKNMRSCLAMGGDRGVLLQTDVQASPFATAKVLAEAIKEESPDLVLFGIKSADGDNYQVSAMCASLLDMPFVEGAIHLDVQDNCLHAKSELDGQHQELEADFPCIASVNKGGAEPRISSLINIRKARKKELKVVAVEPVASSFEVASMSLPPERSGGKIVGEGPDAVEELFRLLKEEAKVL